MSYFLYSETAFNHEGDLSYLLRLIDMSHASGAHGVKFQVLMEPDELIVPTHPDYAVIAGSSFSEAEWEKVFQHTRSLGIKIVAMPLDRHAVSFVQAQKVDYLDLHSVSFYDERLLAAMEKTRIPVILGIGGRTVAEINEKIQRFGSESALMVGFQSFPTDLREIRMKKIQLFAGLYPELQIGYADHTSYENDYAVTSMDYAYLMGARIFEKHVTLNEGIKRTDFSAAVGGEKLRQIRERLDFLDSVLGMPSHEVLEMSEGEIKYRDRQKFLVASRNLPARHALSLDDVAFKMTGRGSGISPQQFREGSLLARAVAVNEPILAEDLT